MALTRRIHTVGNRTRYVLDYCEWLEPGMTLVSGTATTTSTTATVDGVSNTSKELVFFVKDGAANDSFTVAIQIVDSKGEIKNDTIDFSVVAP